MKLKKGTAVYLISNWNRKGTVSVAPAVVESWGAKQATFRYTTGKMTKTAWAVQSLNATVDSLHVLVGTKAEADAYAANLSLDYLGYERGHIVTCLANNNGELGYTRAIYKQWLQLNAGHVIDRPE